MTYAPWTTRFLAGVIDRLIPLIVVIAGGWLEYSTRVNNCLGDQVADAVPYCATGNSAVGVTVWMLALVGALGFVVWNAGYLQGRTGSSIGKRVLKIRLISEHTGQPVGFGRAVVRELAHGVDSLFCYVGYLFPLWDAKKQTLADKIMKTVCVPGVRETPPDPQPLEG